MINLMKSEILKIRSTQVWFWMLLLAVALTACTIVTGTARSSDDHRRRRRRRLLRHLHSSGGPAMALLVLGLLGLTTEFRHKTITPTLLATPNRWQLLVGKALSYVDLLALLRAGLRRASTSPSRSYGCDAKNVPIEFGHGVVRRRHQSLPVAGADSPFSAWGWAP